MKLNKAQLKKILKEVVRELVSEGAFDKTIQECVGPRANGSRRRPAANDFAASFGGGAPVQQGAAPAFNSSEHMSPNAKLQTLSRIAAAEAAGGDKEQAKIMEAIFADTASTTLQKQISYESHGGSSLYANEQISPEEERQEMAELDALSGGKGAEHWAALAFGKYNK